MAIIKSNAFDNSAITSFSVASNVNFIGNNAFANCKNFQIIEFREMFGYTSNAIIMIPVKMIEHFL